MYTERRPLEELRPWVVAVWRSDHEGEAVTVLPDGCADLIFDLDREQVSVVGTMTRPLHVPAGANANLLGIRFRPGRISALLPVPIREITDATLPLRDVARRIDLHPDAVERELMPLLRDGERRVDAAVGLMAGGVTSIDTIAARIGTTRQHLGRLFSQHVGVAPKTFARIIRFRHALRLGRHHAIADVAAQLGYSDQSHLIADFREFSGTTPVPFFLSRGGGTA
jgi:AraC-like DNA-binding protein